LHIKLYIWIHRDSFSTEPCHGAHSILTRLIIVVRAKPAMIIEEEFVYINFKGEIK
jgi:hypothetical protein